MLDGNWGPLDPHSVGMVIDGIVGVGEGTRGSLALGQLQGSRLAPQHAPGGLSDLHLHR